MMERLFLLQYVVAGAIRLWLLHSDYRQVIADRVEVSTPLNSWKKVTEGVFLQDEGVDPYSGDLFHETPLGLAVLGFMMHYLSPLLGLIFTACDLLTAYLLHKTALKFMRELRLKQNQDLKKYAKGTASLLLSDDDQKAAPAYVMSAYLFNPYIILNCVGKTTTVFSNFCLASVFLLMITGRRVLCCLFLAFVTLQSMYPVVLIVPVALYIARRDLKGPLYRKRETAFKRSIFFTVVTFILLLAMLLLLSHSLCGSWKFLSSTFGFILNVPELRPNVGLFWYFFTEMFEHFRALFICAFQINAVALYVAPLTLRFHNEPMLLAISLTALTAVFKSYPCLGDVGFYLGLLPMWRHLFSFMQQGFIVGCFFVITSVLGPVFWHLWIYSRSANANFYFGVTLAFATAQIFLVTDILFAYIKREFYLHNGLKREVDGKNAKLVLD